MLNKLLLISWTTEAKMSTFHVRRDSKIKSLHLNYLHGAHRRAIKAGQLAFSQLWKHIHPLKVSAPVIIPLLVGEWGESNRKTVRYVYRKTCHSTTATWLCLYYMPENTNQQWAVAPYRKASPLVPGSSFLLPSSHLRSAEGWMQRESKPEGFGGGLGTRVMLLTLPG